MTWWDTAIVLAALLAVTVIAGILFQHRRAQGPTRNPLESVEPGRLGADCLGENATLLQFSSSAGRWCTAVHHCVSAVSADHEGVLHLDIDVSDRPDIAAHFGVVQTPTTLLLDHDGVEQARFSGTPGRDLLELEIRRVISERSAV